GSLGRMTTARLDGDTLNRIHLLNKFEQYRAAASPAGGQISDLALPARCGTHCIALGSFDRIRPRSLQGTSRSADPRSWTGPGGDRFDAAPRPRGGARASPAARSGRDGTRR